VDVEEGDTVEEVREGTKATIHTIGHEEGVWSFLNQESSL
jgi:hypothetical protein